MLLNANDGITSSNGVQSDLLEIFLLHGNVHIDALVILLLAQWQLSALSTAGARFVLVR